MTGGIRKEDVFDADFIDAAELASSGSTQYLTGVTVTSTTSGTKRVVVSGFNLIHDHDHPIEVGDKVILSGNAAAGTYTVNAIIDDSTFSVVEAIVTSTGGAVAFAYPVGASKVGIDATSLGAVTTDVDATIRAHALFRQLVHLTDLDGPMEGFASGAYAEITTPGPFPTVCTWWESSAKLKKILRQTVTYNANKTWATETWDVYAADGSTILHTISDAISYSAVFETSRTRTLT